MTQLDLWIHRYVAKGSWPWGGAYSKDLNLAWGLLSRLRLMSCVKSVHVDTVDTSAQMGGWAASIYVETEQGAGAVTAVHGDAAMAICLMVKKVYEQHLGACI